MAKRPSIVRAADPVAAAAELLGAALARVVSERGYARLAIPGGSALRAVGPARARLGAAWRRVRLTWTDERCVPLAHALSNRGAAYRSGALDERDPPADLVPLFLDAESGNEAVRRVERALAACFGGELDVVLLGIGEDGHVASLFPDVRPPEGACVAFVRSSPKPPAARITLTRALLASAPHTVLLATGKAKRSALARVLAGDPSLAITGLPRLRVVTDIPLEEEEAT